MHLKGQTRKSIAVVVSLLGLCAFGATQAGASPGGSTQGGFWTFASSPFHPPAMTVRQSKPGLAPGDLFLDVTDNVQVQGTFPGQVGGEIYDRAGNPIYFLPVPAHTVITDFRKQVYQGHPVITWWQGSLKLLGHPVGDAYGIGQGIIMNNQYQVIARVNGTKSLPVDSHEFLLDSSGVAWVIAYVQKPADERSVGGPRHATLLDSIVEGINVKSGKVVYRWDALTHVPISATYDKPKGRPLDPFHLNSIDVDSHGNLLISMRNTSAVYLVKRTTGRIQWTLGGKRSTFKLERGTRFFLQHDARLMRGNKVSLFDDGGGPPRFEKFARGLVLKLDMKHKAAHLAVQFPHSPGLPVLNQGGEQPLSNGNFLVGWGAAPYVSEYSSTGTLLFDAVFQGPTESYRAFVFPWVGQPTATSTSTGTTSAPNIAVATASSGVTVSASWNGATQVASWRVLNGATSTTATVPVATAPRAGFETAISASGPGQFWAVQALDSTGKVLGTSPTVHQ